MVLYIASLRLKFAYYLTHRIPVQTIFDAHPGGCAAIAMSPDAKYIATISSNLPQVKLKCLTLISVKKTNLSTIQSAYVHKKIQNYLAGLRPVKNNMNNLKCCIWYFSRLSPCGIGQLMVRRQCVLLCWMTTLESR